MAWVPRLIREPYTETPSRSIRKTSGYRMPLWGDAEWRKCWGPDGRNRRGFPYGPQTYRPRLDRRVTGRCLGASFTAMTEEEATTRATRVTARTLIAGLHGDNGRALLGSGCVALPGAAVIWVMSHATAAVQVRRHDAPAVASGVHHAAPGRTPPGTLDLHPAWRRPSCRRPRRATKGPRARGRGCPSAAHRGPDGWHGGNAVRGDRR